MKAFSIVALITISLNLLTVLFSTDTDAVSFAGVTASLIGIALAIASLATMRKKSGSAGGLPQTSQLEKLYELRQKGALTEEEFQAKKAQVLAT
jgi:hypothetical protein